MDVLACLVCSRIWLSQFHVLSLTYRSAKGGCFGMFSMFKHQIISVSYFGSLTYRGAKGGGFGMFSTLLKRIKGTHYFFRYILM